MTSHVILQYFFFNFFYFYNVLVGEKSVEQTASYFNYKIRSLALKLGLVTKGEIIKTQVQQFHQFVICLASHRLYNY